MTPEQSRALDRFSEVRRDKPDGGVWVCLADGEAYEPHQVAAVIRIAHRSPHSAVGVGFLDLEPVPGDHYWAMFVNSRHAVRVWHPVEWRAHAFARLAEPDFWEDVIFGEYDSATTNDDILCGDVTVGNLNDIRQAVCAGLDQFIWRQFKSKRRQPARRVGGDGEILDEDGNLVGFTAEGKS